MSWTIIFLYILAVIFLLSFVEKLSNVYGKGKEGTSALFYCILFIITLYTAITAHNSPQAIDVYRGKTSLEITSVNNIPTDTTVVWKNN